MSGDLAGARVLVIGASGFIGARLVERLVLEHGAHVRVLVRSVASATRVARLPIEVVVGDVRDAPALAAASDQCAVIFNCAKGSGRDAALRRATDVDGARNVVEAAAQAGARVVHVSSLAVYDLPADGDVDERTAPAPPGDVYSDAKLAGERAVLAHAKQCGVPAVVIQPTVVYGPYATVHGSDILDELRARPMILIDGGAGTCNAVYIDDVVTALTLAATSDLAVGERVLISGPEYPTWREFFAAFERMLGVERTVSMTKAEALAFWRHSRRRPWLFAEALRSVKADRALRKRLLGTREGVLARTIAERVAPEALSSAERWAAAHDAASQAATRNVARPGNPSDAVPAEPSPTVAGPLRPWLVDYHAKRARVRTDRARALLGFEPVFSLDFGMRLTEAWARWAGLLDPGVSE